MSRKTLLSGAAAVALALGAMQAHAASIPTNLEIKETDINKQLTDLADLVSKQGDTIEEISEIKSQFEDLQNSIAELKEGNTAAGADELQEAKDAIAELKQTISEMEAKANRGGDGADDGGDDNTDVEAHTKAWLSFMKKGLDDGLEDLEQKALNIGTDADGGYAIPDETDGQILDLMRDHSPFRRLANVKQVRSEKYKKIVNLGGAGSGWVGEVAARGETTTPQLVEIVPPMGEIYANPAITQRGLDDIPSVESWLTDEVNQEFADQEGGSFISGDGVNKPKGILAYTFSTSDDASRVFGQVQKINTGVADNLPASDTAVEDMLIDVIHSLKKGHRKGAVWLMNGKTLARIRKLRDADGNKLWTRSMQDGHPGMLLGYPVEEDENMPDIGAGNIPIVFGNIKRAYTLLDRMGTRVLRDAFTNKPYVHFYTTKRIGGGVIDSEAYKGISCEV